MTEASMAEATSADIVDGVDEPARSVDEPARSTSDSLRPRLVVWAGWLAAVGMAIAGLALLATTSWRSIPDSYGFPGFTAPFAFSYGTIGAIVLLRRPGNRVGRVLLITGLLAGFQVLYTAYATYGLLYAPGSLPFAIVAAWLLSWAWIPFMFLAGPGLMSIFPDGRFVSPAWRRVLLGSIAFPALMGTVAALRHGPINNFAVVDNPFGIIPLPAAGPLLTLGFLGLSSSIVVAAASLVIRYRRADQDRRQQLKWFAAASLLLAISTPFGFVGGKVGQILFLAAVATIPIATGIAVLRYGLYEIDTIINRALVYGLLTALLAGLYAASVGLMQRVSQAFTGTNSDAAIVLTTLIVVTAFTPIKSRLQTIVDSRFKQNIDPSARIRAFTDELDARMWPLDIQRLVARFLDVAVDACQATGGRIEMARPGGRVWSASTAATDNGPTVTLAGASGDTTVRLWLSSRPGKTHLSANAVEAVEAGLAHLAKGAAEG
jgi:hypothetical protein